MLIAAVVLTLTYIGVAFTRLPRLNIDRTSAAFTGGVLMVLLGVLAAQEAVAAIDFDTIALLLGMMVIVAALKVVGFFNLLAVETLTIAGTPFKLLVLVVVATGVASAFLVNDAVVLLFTPVVIEVCRTRKVNPVPYLIAEAMASNIGSAATIVGNPQNMLIGITSGISFARFFLYMLPVSILSSVVLIAAVHRLYRKSLEQDFDSAPAPRTQVRTYDIGVIRWLMPVVVLVVAAFFASSWLGLSVPLIALGCAVLILLLSKARPSAVMREVDWLLLLFFAGLFVVIGGAHKAGVLDVFIRQVKLSPDLSGIVSIAVVSTVVSQIVSNVPLTMLLLPVLKDVPGDVLWVALAAGTTLGGNLTILGAVANIIVAEVAAREGVIVGFGEFIKVGIVVTLVTVFLAVLVLGGEYYLGLLR